MEFSKKIAQFNALQSQINPHFLYNALDVIRMKAMMENDDDVSTMIYIMSKLYRNMIKDQQIIYIEQEVDFAKLYMDFFKIRYGESLSVDFHVDSSINKYGTIKHILQPVLENYIVHGFECDNPNSRIEIFGTEYDGIVVFKISDNGCGMDRQCLEQIRESFHVKQNGEVKSGIGLANLNERLQLVYGNQCGLSVDSELNKGTVVTIRIRAKSISELKDSLGI